MGIEKKQMVRKDQLYVRAPQGRISQEGFVKQVKQKSVVEVLKEGDPPAPELAELYRGWLH